MGVAGEVAGLRGDGCGAVGVLGGRAWPWRGRGTKLEVSTEAGRRGEISIRGGGLGPPADATSGEDPSPGMSCPTRGPAAGAAHGKPTSAAFLR